MRVDRNVILSLFFVIIYVWRSFQSSNNVIEARGSDESQRKETDSSISGPRCACSANYVMTMRHGSQMVNKRICTDLFRGTSQNAFEKREND